MSKYQHLDLSELDDAILISFKKHRHLLNDAAAIAIGNELDLLADQPRCRKVVIDFSGVEHVSTLIGLWRANRVFRQRSEAPGNSHANFGRRRPIMR